MLKKTNTTHQLFFLYWLVCYMNCVVKSNSKPIIFLSQMVVPKRAAMLLDRIMVALHHALEDNDKEGVQRIADVYKSSRHGANTPPHVDKELMHQYKGNYTFMRFSRLLKHFLWAIRFIIAHFCECYFYSWQWKWHELFWDTSSDRCKCGKKYERSWRSTFNRWIGKYP